MYGAILGDIIGSPYEFDMGDKTKDFPLFNEDSTFTDDSVMTIAVADALLCGAKDPERIKTLLVYSMQRWGRKDPTAGYGGMFYQWLFADDPQPYGSFGNGSAMRVSSVGWLYDTLEETWKTARLTAEVTHNHPEGIKGAECVASVIWMARNGKSKQEIREFVTDTFGYDLSRTCDEIRPEYYHVESCQQTVPEAITAFLEGESFEDVIRTAVSLGGDCDTLTCIAGSMAEAFYGVPEELKEECRKRITPEMREVLARFEKRAIQKSEFRIQNDRPSDVVRDPSTFTRGCRPFSTENCPLDSFPGATNPGMTPADESLMKAGKNMDKEKLIEELLEKPCMVVDFLPEQVPEKDARQYFAMEKYYLEPERYAGILEKFTDILLKLNCYYNFSVCEAAVGKLFDNPAPEWLAGKIREKKDLCVLLPEEKVLITLNRDDLYMSVYNASGKVLEIIKKLAGANGLFVW